MTYDSFIDSPIAAGEVALDGRWLRVNGSLCKLLGYSQQELLSSRVRDITHPDDRPYSVTIVDQALRHHEQHQEELKRYLRKDGQVVWALLKTTLKRDSHGEPTHFVSFLEDVTEQVHNDPVTRRLARRLHTNLELERQKIARQLHDELGQSLNALKVDLAWLQNKVPKTYKARTAHLQDVADSILSSLRRLWMELRPAILDELGLQPAIEWLLQETCGLNGISWKFLPPPRTLRLDSQTRANLFRICRDALTLLIQPDKTQSIEVDLQVHPDLLQLSLKATGHQAQPPCPRLLALQDLVKLLGGQMQLTSTPEYAALGVDLPQERALEDNRGVPPEWA